MGKERFESQNIQLGLAWLAFVVVGFFGIWHHELWRDEVHSAMIAFESQSLGDLVQRKAYEGHPLMWYLLIYALKQFTSDWFAVSVLQLSLAAVAAAIVLFKAPFRVWERMLIVFGYFFLFEYGILARNYAIELIFLFGVCAAYPLRQTAKGQFLIALLLFFLMQTNFYGLLLGTLLSVFIAWELVPPLVREREWLPLSKVLVRAALPILSGIALSFWSIQPPSDSGVAPYPIALMNLFYGISTIWKGFVPIPHFSINFWNTNFLDIKDFKYNSHIQTLCLVPLLMALSRFWAGHRALRYLFWIGVLIMTLFVAFRYSGAMRHYGHFYLWFLVCLWLQRLTPIDKQTSPKIPPSVSWQKFNNWVDNNFFKTLIAGHVGAAMIALSIDAIFPFSNGKMMSTYIKKNESRYPFIVAYQDYSAESYLAYLHRSAYCPIIRDSFYYVIFNEKRLEEKFYLPLLATIQEDFEPRLDSVLFITSLSMKDSLYYLPLQPLDSFPKTIVEDEQYFLYKFKKNNQ